MKSLKAFAEVGLEEIYSRVIGALSDGLTCKTSRRIKQSAFAFSLSFAGESICRRTRWPDTVEISRKDRKNLGERKTIN